MKKHRLRPVSNLQPSDSKSGFHTTELRRSPYLSSLGLNRPPSAAPGATTEALNDTSAVVEFSDCSRTCCCWPRNSAVKTSVIKTPPIVKREVSKFIIYCYFYTTAGKQTFNSAVKASLIATAIESKFSRNIVETIFGTELCVAGLKIFFEILKKKENADGRIKLAMAKLVGIR